MARLSIDNHRDFPSEVQGILAVVIIKWVDMILKSSRIGCAGLSPSNKLNIERGLACIRRISTLFFAFEIWKDFYMWVPCVHTVVWCLCSAEMILYRRPITLWWLAQYASPTYITSTVITSITTFREAKVKGALEHLIGRPDSNNDFITTISNLSVRACVLN